MRKKNEIILIKFWFFISEMIVELAKPHFFASKHRHLMWYLICCSIHIAQTTMFFLFFHIWSSDHKALKVYSVPNAQCANWTEPSWKELLLATSNWHHFRLSTSFYVASNWIKNQMHVLCTHLEFQLWIN